MIVPMKKVSIITLEAEKKATLSALRKLGIVHIEKLQGGGETVAALKDSAALLSRAVSIVREVKKQKKAPYGFFENVNRGQVLDEAKKIIALAEEKKSRFEEIIRDKSDVERFQKWGKVHPNDFSYLKEKGLALSLYEIESAKYAELPNEAKTIFVNGDKQVTRFLLWGNKSDALTAFARKVPLPTISTEDLLFRIKQNEARIREIEKELFDASKFTGAFIRLQTVLQKELEFETTYSGMHADGQSEKALSWISGFVPASEVSKVEQAARENKWALLSSDPSDEDEVPTKLQNGKLVSLIYPLTDFLGTVPGYRETDISGWFLFFFTIFFGMIFGDGGYGILLLFTSLFLTVKTKRSAASGLMVLLSLATIAWGTITCTWFGLPAERIPYFLRRISIPPFSNAYASEYDGIHSLFTTGQNLQIFCFTLALVQLSVAHIKCFFANIKSAKALGDFGNLMLLWGMYYIVLMLVISGKIFSLDKIIYGIPVGKVSLALIGVGFAFSFSFINYAGNFLQSVSESAKNGISVILGVVNVFSDIVSYIRLWAVALAGSAISNTVNEMAGPLWGSAMRFGAFIVFLLFGHGLNMMLNVLSVIVHGVRLNTLEFSNHLGMSWQGFKYEPFCE